MDFLEVSGGIRLVSDAAVVTSWKGERGSGGGGYSQRHVCVCVCAALCVSWVLLIVYMRKGSE